MMISRTTTSLLFVLLAVAAVVSADTTTRILDTSSVTKDDILEQKSNAIDKIRRRQLGEAQGLMNDPRVDVDPTTLTEEEIEEMTSEELEEEDEYIGCLCPCDLPDGEEGVLIHTHDMALQAETEVKDHQDGDEKAMASHVLCVDDLLSIEFVAEGRGNCDKECFFEGANDELDTGAEDSEEFSSFSDSEDNSLGFSDEDEDEEESESESSSRSGESSSGDSDSDSDSDGDSGSDDEDGDSDEESSSEGDSDSDGSSSSSSSSEGDSKDEDADSIDLGEEDEDADSIDLGEEDDEDGDSIDLDTPP